MQYVELHARSAFSFLEGASVPEALAYACAAQQLPGMALLDRNGLYGSARFHLITKSNKIKSHVGAEISVGETPSLDRPYYPLLVANRTGYQNLCRLITKTKLRAQKNKPTAATLSELEEHAEGLVCLTGDENGLLSAALRNGGKEEARQLLERLRSIFGRNNLYVELQRHFRPEQEQRNHAAIDLARELSLPLLATNGVLYATADDRHVLDALTCVKQKCTLDEAGQRLQINGERHVRTCEEMIEVFQDLPEAIANTSELSAKLEFTLEKLGYEFPKYPVPSGETQITFLRAQVTKGAHERYRPIADRVRRQLDRELRLIEKLDLAGYFLIVWDLVKFCRENHILVQGRGSAANSAVCYSLGITAVDPIAMDLLFERFLSEERGEWPDIDLDLPSGDERERVIQYVYQRYGERGAAMTANVITYRSKSAAREMGKVLGFDPESLTRLSAAAGSWEWRGPDDTFDEYFRKAGFDLANSRIHCFLGLCKRVLDLPRHLGQHSGGMVVCQGALDSVVPLEPASMPGRVVVQWDKDDCADLGIVKVDLLGLGMMAAIRESIDLIRDHYQEEVDLAHIPADQPDVYDTIRKADTVGMFQIESRAQMPSLPRNNPQRFYDLVVQVALIRPGPIVGQMTNPYLKRRQGKERVTYPHESLVPVLERTLGVPLFQEQLLRMAMICANFTGGEAEELRRALGHKRSEQRMRQIETKLRAGMTQNGIQAEAQDKIVQFVSSFALYGFPESHSASFALLAYASAFLKVRYLAAFTCALLNCQPMGFYSPATLVKDAQRRGLKVKPVDITCSDWNCTLENQGQGIALRLGLRYVRSFRQATAEAVVASRRERSFSSIADLTMRVPQLSKSDLRMLATVGALNPIFGPAVSAHRRDALWQVQKYGSRVPALLEGDVGQDQASPLKQMDTEERLIADYHGTGMTIGPHPMAYRRQELRQMGIVSASELRKLPHNRPAIAAGCVITRQRPGTAKGLIFLTLEDETGHANIIVMPDVYSADSMAVLHERFVRVEGRVQNQDGIVHLKAERVSPLLWSVRLKLSRTIFIDSKVFAMSSSPIGYATLLRRELCARNASYAALHQLPHLTSYGEMPVVVYQPFPCGTQHGNFIRASYRAIQRRPQWNRRFEKVHSQAGRAFPKSDCVSKELDSSMSSDALLMNIFCYPGVTKRRELCLMLGTDTGDLPEFGFKPRIPLTSGFVERTEIDMRLGPVLFEAKLTESDFQTQKAAIVEGYRDLTELFDCRELSRIGHEYVSYQLLRNVLAAHTLNLSFCVLLDARRPDLREQWYAVMRCVRSMDLRTRCKILTWQELSAALPGRLQSFLELKYGIAV